MKKFDQDYEVTSIFSLKSLNTIPQSPPIEVTILFDNVANIFTYLNSGWAVHHLIEKIIKGIRPQIFLLLAEYSQV